MESCRFCGAALFDDDDFCPHCGKRLRVGRQRSYDSYYDSADSEFAAAQPSGACATSLWFGAIGVVVYLGIFSFAVVAEVNAQKAPPKGYFVAVGCAMFLVGLLNLIGIVFGITGLSQGPSNKWMGIVGLILNGLEGSFFVVVLLMTLSRMNG